jgi:3-hydroxybutyryl-CoA dehydrogenase
METKPGQAPVGILGAGQIGTAAAILASRSGEEVILWTRNEKKIQQIKSALKELADFCDAQIGKSEKTAERIEITTDFSLVDNSCAIILECIAENLQEKIDLLNKLISCRQRDALILSATSALSISKMAAGARLESMLVGAHFWNPPYLVPVVEIIAGEKTPKEKVQRACIWMEKLDRIPVVCKDIPGFIGNRLMHAMWREALALVDAGHCSPADIDRIVKYTFALRLPALGPMENMDLVGLGLVNSVEEYLFPDLAVNAAPSKILKEKLSAGKSGMSVGEGFYQWTPETAKAMIRRRDLTILHQLKWMIEISCDNSEK